MLVGQCVNTFNQKNGDKQNKTLRLDKIPECADDGGKHIGEPFVFCRTDEYIECKDRENQPESVCVADDVPRGKPKAEYREKKAEKSV